MPDNVKHLLLVEDEAPLRQAIAEQLTDRGYHVAQAASGEQAIQRLADFAFAVIVTDLRLPGVDGSFVPVAAVERYPDIVAIVVTGFGTVKDAVEAIKRGAWDFVSKPFQIDELLHVLDSALEPSITTVRGGSSASSRSTAARSPRRCSRRSSSATSAARSPEPSARGRDAWGDRKGKRR